jgi:signal transduction histidine kinase
VAASGRGAAALLGRGADYDLVLTDLHMEDGDGLSLLEEVRAHSPFTITIVLTGFAAVESAIAALRQGAYDYLTKPCIIDELILTVRRGIEHRRLTLAEREARAGLEELNRGLESRVEERTAELSRVNRELTEANRMKDIFLATLSHELRTPLTPVLGWVNLLRAGGAAVDAKMLAQGLDAIERNARLQARLVDDLLDISRIVSGKLRIEWEPVNLCAVVELAAETVRADAAAREIDLAVEMPDCPVVVQGAAVRLQQIVWNLLSNAVKFTPRGGRVLARAWREGGQACVEVSDTGAGIAPEFLPHVFDRFRQADGRITRQHGGLGLGLAIARHLVEMHGGTIAAESPGPGAGSTFRVRLPLMELRNADAGLRIDEAHVASHHPSPVARHSSPLSGLHVLVVDDDEDTRELMAAVLGRAGARVTRAATAAEAFDAVVRLRPDVLLADIGMPVEDGYTLISRVRALGREADGNVPAAALTAYARPEDRARALSAGYQLHIAKPSDPAALVSAVARLAGRAAGE